MALDILHDNWGPYTHTEVENALKAYLSGLDDRINQAIQSGGVGLNDLSQEVRDLLDKADKALQSGDIAEWAKAQDKPGYTVSEITGVEGFQNLLAKLQDMDAKIQEAAASGGVDPDDEMSSTSEKPVQNKVIKAYVDAAVLTLQNALNALMNGQSVTDAIDTFNEIVDFLDDIDTDDPTLANQLLALNNDITALQNTLSSKANSADVYTKSEVDTKVADAGKVKSVTLNGVTPPVDNNGNINLGTIHDGTDGDDGITPHIGQDGYWYIGTTNTGVKAQGERGNDGVASADEVVVVNNLDGEPADLEEGQVAVLGADQGKELKMAIDNKGVSFEVKGDTLFIRTAASPRVNVLPTSIQFDDTIFGNTRTATVHIYGRNLTSQVEVQVSGVGFSGSAQLLPNGDGKVDADVTITFAPTADTGTEEESGRSYEGSVTAVCNGAESASATLEGFGVRAITPRITASIDKAALKGVLDTTADGQYSSEPATATLHVQASNVNQVLTLAVDNAKFALSESQVSVEDAMRGKDITVTYLRQSAVTATDDEGTITITAAHDNTTAQSTVAVSGATGAKITSGTIGTFDGIAYSYDGNNVACKKSSSTPVELVIPAYFYDSYGYKYTPVAFNTNAFADSAIRSLVAGSNISKVYSSAFSSCASLKTAVFKSWGTMRDFVFSDCTALESVDFISINFASRNNIFSGCTKLASVTVRSSSKVSINNNSHFTKATLTIGGEDKEVFYYVDSDGNNQQKKLYVPSALVSSYQQDAIWGMFDVQPISE